MRSSISEHGTPTKKSNPRPSRRSASSAPETVIVVSLTQAFIAGPTFEGSAGSTPAAARLYLARCEGPAVRSAIARARRRAPRPRQSPRAAPRHAGAAPGKGLPDRVAVGSVVVRLPAATEGLQTKAPRAGLYRRTESRHRVSVGRRPIRAAVRHGDGTGAPQSGPDPHARRHASLACRKVCEPDDSHRVLRGRRRRVRARGESRAPGR